MMRACLFVAVCALSVPALAQEDVESKAEHTVSLKLEPAFSRSDVFDLDEEFVNKSEFALAYKFSQPTPLLRQNLSLTAGFVASPTRFDRGPDTTGVFGEIMFGDSAIHLRDLLGASAVDVLALREEPNPENRGPKVNPYISFRHTETFENFLGAATGDNQVLGAGLEVRDLFSRVCWGEKTSEESAPLTCKGSETVDGRSYAGAVDFSRTWSADPAEENDTYSGKAMLDLAPFKNTTRVGFSASVSRVVFDSAVDLFGDLRRDWKYGGKISLDFKPFLTRKRIESFSASVGVSQTWLESTDDSKDGSDFRVLASIGYTFNLK